MENTKFRAYINRVNKVLYHVEYISNAWLAYDMTSNPHGFITYNVDFADGDRVDESTGFKDVHDNLLYEHDLVETEHGIGEIVRGSTGQWFIEGNFIVKLYNNRCNRLGASYNLKGEV